MSAKRFEFSSYYKVLYIFYPYLATLKRVLFEFMAILQSIFIDIATKREPQSVFKRELKILTKP
ncbi:hypothetical protein HpHA237_08910 [Helicobacter pylori]